MTLRDYLPGRASCEQVPLTQTVRAQLRHTVPQARARSERGSVTALVLPLGNAADSPHLVTMVEEQIAAQWSHWSSL